MLVKSFFKALIFHNNIARSQRNAFQNHHQNVNFLRNKIMIVVDFKQKILIGMSPRQVKSIMLCLALNKPI
jgi:hypothetical protein